MAGPSDTHVTRAQVRVEKVTIRDFRGLTAEVELEPQLTLLVGRNNSGKSRILRAIALALGDAPAELDDLTVGSDHSATVDVVVAPLPDEQGQEVFTDEIGQTVNPEPVSQEPLRERFAWRATVRRSAEGEGARADFTRLTWNGRDWALAENAQSISRFRELRYVAGSMIGAQRDLADEQARRGTAIRRLLTSLDIAPDTEAELVSQLRALGDRIADSSQALQAIRRALKTAEDRVGGFGTVGLNALPVDLEELARAISFDLDSGGGAGMLPLRLHGSGPRSLASILVQGVYYDRRLGRDRPESLPHPVSLLEEPEAHLHPQMQAELPGLLSGIPGQVVASTHSATLVSHVDHDCVRLLRSDDARRVDVIDLKVVDDAASDQSEVDRLRRPELHASEIKKVKRTVERPFGEVLFASAIVVGDGALERAFLPPVLRHALGPLGHGIVVVDPESMAKAVPIVKLANAIGVPWYLFVDRDGPGEKDAAGICQQFGVLDGRGSDRRVYVADQGGATEMMLCTSYEEMCRRVVVGLRPDLADSGYETLTLMTHVKGHAGGHYARELIEKYPDPTTWPTGLRTLIDVLRAALQTEERDAHVP